MFPTILAITHYVSFKFENIIRFDCLGGCQTTTDLGGEGGVGGVSGCSDDAPALERLDDKAYFAFNVVKASDASRLTADFLDKVMKAHTFIRFNDEDDPECAIQCMQILPKHTRCIQVPTYVEA